MSNKSKLWLQSQLEASKKREEILKWACNFYGNIENWRNPEYPQGNKYNQIDSEDGTDLEQFFKGKHLIAGNRARRALKQASEIA